MAISPDNKLLCSGDRDGSIRIWKVGTGKQVGKFGELKKGVSNVAFHPLGKLIATTDGEGGTYMWTVTGKRLRSFPVPEVDGFMCGTLKFSPDGRRLIAVGLTKGRFIIYIWDVNNGHCVGTIRGESDLTGVDFNPDGSWLAVVNKNTISIFDFPSRAKLFTLPHDDDVYAVAFSPDGKRLAAIVQESGSLYIWNCTPLGE